MEFSGRIMKVLPAMEGTSQRTGNAYKIQPFIFEYFEQPTDRYSDKVVLETFDTKIMEQLEEGRTVRIGFGHKTEERNGRYFNRLTMYKFEVEGHTAAPQPSKEDIEQLQREMAKIPPQPGETSQNADEKEDDLPF